MPLTQVIKSTTNLLRARILKSTGSWYTAETESGKVYACRPRGKLRLKGFKLTNPVAVGDWVQIEVEDDSTAVLTEILPRDNYIIRKSPRNRKNDQILAANLDQMIIFASIKEPRTSTGFIDRLLVVAEMFHIPSVLVVNKKDVYDENDLAKFELWKETYETIGYPVHLISGIDEKDCLAMASLFDKKTSLITGHSGVGKSTVVNSIIPGLNLKTKEISRLHKKGTHTTTFAEMHKIPTGGFVIDSPGIKEMEIIDLQLEEVGHYFPEFRPILAECKFNNCLHRDEPKCAIKEAVASEVIAESRFINYHNILSDVEEINYWER